MRRLILSRSNIRNSSNIKCIKRKESSNLEGGFTRLERYSKQGKARKVTTKKLQDLQKETRPHAFSSEKKKVTKEKKTEKRERERRKETNAARQKAVVAISNLCVFLRLCCSVLNLGDTNERRTKKKKKKKLPFVYLCWVSGWIWLWSRISGFVSKDVCVQCVVMSPKKKNTRLTCCPFEVTFVVWIVVA